MTFFRRSWAGNPSNPSNFVALLIVSNLALTSLLVPEFFKVNQNNTSKADVAPWCYKWVDWIGFDWIGWIGWVYPGGGMYRAPYGANKSRRCSEKAHQLY